MTQTFYIVFSIILNMVIITNTEKLKEVRRDLKNIKSIYGDGYKIKTYKNSLGQFGEIYLKNGLNIYFGEIGKNPQYYETHKDIYSYFEKYCFKYGYDIK